MKLGRWVSRALYDLLAWRSHESNRIFRKINEKLARGEEPAAILAWAQTEWLKTLSHDRKITQRWAEIELAIEYDDYAAYLKVSGWGEDCVGSKSAYDLLRAQWKEKK